jgi:enamine deaminase RidA (YjgF/YER057c/UK114 family)
VTPRERAARLGIELPPPARALGAYTPVRVEGRQAWVSGHTARRPDGGRVNGVVGEDVDVATARDEARTAAINLLAALESTVGLDSVAGVLHLRGYVRAASGFTEHPRVLDGASGVLHEVFGTGGAHARTAVGVASLPGGACVEVEAVFTLREECPR